MVTSTKALIIRGAVLLSLASGCGSQPAAESAKGDVSNFGWQSKQAQRSWTYSNDQSSRANSKKGAGTVLAVAGGIVVVASAATLATQASAAAGGGGSPELTSGATGASVVGVGLLGVGAAYLYLANEEGKAARRAEVRAFREEERHRRDCLRNYQATAEEWRRLAKRCKDRPAGAACEARTQLEALRKQYAACANPSWSTEAESTEVTGLASSP